MRSLVNNLFLRYFTVLQEGGFVDVRAAAVARSDELEEVNPGRARVTPRNVERRGEISTNGGRPAGGLNDVISI